MDDDLNRITEGIIEAAITVHRELGPGLLESAYESCLFHELVQSGYDVKKQVELPIHYRGIKLDCGYRLDLVVENQVIMELKSVDAIESIHKAQVLSYLKLSGHQVALLINFNVKLLKNGISRFIV